MCFYRLLANFSLQEEAMDVYALTEGPSFLFLERWQETPQCVGV